MWSKRLKRARQIAGLTQKQLAEKWGVSSQLISDYEGGRVNIPKWNQIKIMEMEDGQAFIVSHR